MTNSSVNPLLEVKNLCMNFTTKRRGKKTIIKAVDKVSFNIQKGETFGIVGESGCGKTTTGRAIIRLCTPSSGEVLFNGKVISGKMNSGLRRYITDNIAMIFQDPIAALNPRMTVEEIIGEGLKLRGVKDKEQRSKKVREMLLKVALHPEHATRYPHEFSGGQRQRIGIARALTVNPRLIIADEPVSALDVSVQAQIINLLNNLKSEFGLTTLFIAHNLAVVKYFSDRVGVMYYGKMVELATTGELFRNPLHPYTKALLSSAPQPDPIGEKRRQRIFYDPPGQKLPEELFALREAAPGHFVYCTEEEFEKLKI